MSSSALAHVQVHCSFRRLLSNHQTWSIAAALLSRAYHSHTTSLHMSNSEMKKFRHRRTALVLAVNERPIDRTAREEFSNSLHNILKSRSMHGLVDRGDAYVSVRELLNYQHFRMLTFLTLQKVVNEDRWHRFELLYEPLKGRDIDSWWIRVKEKDEKDVRLDRILSGNDIGAAIYGTTLQKWRSYISQNGIPRLNNNYIEICRAVPIQNFFTSEAPSSKHVLIYINVKKAMDMGIQFYFASKPSPVSLPTPSRHDSPTLSTGAALHSTTTDPNSTSRPPSLTKSPIATKNRVTWIVTPGNEFGLLPPECFIKVEVVRIKNKVLWTSDEGVVEQEPSDENEEETILDSDMESAEDLMNYTAVVKRGYKTKHVDVTEQDLDQFFTDFPTDRAVHSDLKKEALAALSA